MNLDDYHGVETYMSLTTILVRMAAAMVCGAVIGYERERVNMAAGFRTHILVCLASCLVAILTIEITHHAAFSGNAIQIDPIRLIEAVTAGVAFLAAGMIVFSKGKVKGLTTGAGLWFSGAIGLACGLGFWQIALMATVMAIVVLWALSFLDVGSDKDDTKDA